MENPYNVVQYSRKNLQFNLGYKYNWTIGLMIVLIYFILFSWGTAESDLEEEIKGKFYF